MFSGAGDVVAMGALIDAGAQLDFANETGWSALRTAASAGHVPAVKLLIESGASLDRTFPVSLDEVGRIADTSSPLRCRGDLPWTPTPLWEAASKGHLGVVELLVSAGASLAVQNGSVWPRTPVEEAREQHHKGVVRVLESAGVASLCDAALLDDGATIARLCLEGANPDLASATGWTPLQLAAASGNVVAIDALAAAGVEVDLTILVARSGDTALKTAAEAAQVGAIRALVAAGADPNKRSGEMTWTPLRVATGSALVDALHRRRAINALVACGASVDLPSGDEDGRTPLHVAAGAGDVIVVGALLKAGAAVDAVGWMPGGMTALRAASGGGHMEVMRMLLDGGAAVDLAAGAMLSTALRAAAIGGHEAAAEMLLRAGAEVDLPDKRGAPALWRAAGAGSTAVVVLLIAAGAILSDRTFGRTARVEAVRSRHSDTARVLEEAEEAAAEARRRANPYFGYE